MTGTVTYTASSGEEFSALWEPMDKPGTFAVSLWVDDLNKRFVSRGCYVVSNPESRDIMLRLVCEDCVRQAMEERWAHGKAPDPASNWWINLMESRRSSQDSFGTVVYDWQTEGATDGEGARFLVRMSDGCRLVAPADPRDWSQLIKDFEFREGVQWTPVQIAAITIQTGPTGAVGSDWQPEMPKGLNGPAGPSNDSERESAILNWKGGVPGYEWAMPAGMASMYDDARMPEPEIPVTAEMIAAGKRATTDPQGLGAYDAKMIYCAMAAVAPPHLNILAWKRAYDTMAVDRDQMQRERDNVLEIAIDTQNQLNTLTTDRDAWSAQCAALVTERDGLREQLADKDARLVAVFIDPDNKPAPKPEKPPIPANTLNPKQSDTRRIGE